jgi:uridine phosphorylase
MKASPKIREAVVPGENERFVPAILRRDEPVPPRGILCSHPDRAARFSAELLSQTRVIADYRGYRVYAGSYRGHEVFVAYVGIGAPSAAILIEELIAMGAGTILRVGTNDNPSEDENDRAIAVIEESLGTRALTGAGSERPDPALLRAIQNTARRLQIPVAVRRALHIDWYYPFLRPERFSDRPARVRAWIARAAERGAEVRDMESAALF